MIPSTLQTLAQCFAKYPGVGPRQAQRYALFTLKQSPEEREEIIQTLQALQHINLCSACFLPKHQQDKNCIVCSQKERKENIICIVEKETDLMNIEKTHTYSGTYIILGGNISPLRSGTTTPKKRIVALLKRLDSLPQEQNKEIILALNNTREGNFTTLYIQEIFKKKTIPNLTITTLGRGLASGNELEYADEDTVRNAFEGRR